MSITDRSQSRNGTAVRVLAVHTTEGTSYTAAGLRDADWWTGSSHAIADTRTLLTPAEGCVSYDRASWTLRSGNPWSDNIELVAMAGWTRAQWLERPGLLDNCARWLADRSTARGIPLVKLTPAQYRAGGRGVIGHHDHTVGYADGTHWDPGPNFPWDIVLDKARGFAANEEEDLTPAESQMLKDTLAEVMATRRQDLVQLSGSVNRVLAAINTQAIVDAILAKLPAAAGDVDDAAIAAAVESAVRRVFADAGTA
jgi:hypothetical protein